MTTADRVLERRRAAALARHYRDEEALAIAEIARRLRRADATIKAYLYDRLRILKSTRPCPRWTGHAQGRRATDASLACCSVRTQRYVSAELHHFVGKDLPDDDARYDTLLKILRSGLLRPGQLRGVESPQGESDPAGVAFTIQPAAEDTEEMVRAEVVCFCDIPADDLGLHMTKYKHFGISFPKPFLCQQGANPVYYVACDSRAVLSPETDDTLGRLFSAEIRRLLGRNPYFAPGDRDDAWRDAVALHRFARTYMFAFVKPFSVTRAGGEPVPDDDQTNVYMEREWRVLGPVRFALSDVSRVTLPQEYAERFRSDCPGYCGQLTFASPRSGPV